MAKAAKTYQDYEGELIGMSMEMTQTITGFPIDIPEGQYARFNEPVERRGGGRIIGVGNGRNGSKQMLHEGISEDQLRAAGFAPFSPLELLGVIARLEEPAQYTFVNN